MSDDKIALIVDDVPANIDILKGMLSSEFKVKAALKGEKALSIAQRGPHPDLILLDVQMPEMDGLTATKEIVKRYGQDRPIIVAMTANVLKKDRENCADVGMDDFIAKPLLITELERALSTRYQRNGELVNI